MEQAVSDHYACENIRQRPHPAGGLECISRERQQHYDNDEQQRQPGLEMKDRQWQQRKFAPGRYNNGIVEGQKIMDRFIEHVGGKGQAQ